MVDKQLKWEITQTDSGMKISFAGAIDEYTDLATLVPKLKGKVIFHLEGIGRINSEGARRWVDFMRQIEDGPVSELVFVNCSVPMVTQLNMIKAFVGKAYVRSFYAPYFCSSLGKEEERLLSICDITDITRPPVFACDGGVYELDDIPERYLAFVNDHIRK